MIEYAGRGGHPARVGLFGSDDMQLLIFGLDAAFVLGVTREIRARLQFTVRRPAPAVSTSTDGAARAASPYIEQHARASRGHVSLFLRWSISAPRLLSTLAFVPRLRECGDWLTATG